MKQKESIVWRRLDVAGHEYARIFTEMSKRYLNGAAIFGYERQFCKLDYLIECDSEWQTLAAKISGFVGKRMIEIDIAVDAEKRWIINGSENTETVNCLDIDLNFSPVTNTLPVRRLNLAVGQKAEVRAAWLRFPGFTLEPLDQTYERTAKNKYRYESAGGEFVAEIDVNDFGLVTKYPNFWQIEIDV